MELSVSNDFISLFLPDQSEFTTDEIINEFKIYIFRLMNITVDSLIQERINNEYENNQLKVAYKDFFSSRVDSVLNIAKLHNEIITKSNIIKSSLESNIKLIEKNKNTFDENNINKDFEKVINDIKVNKFILKNQALVHFMSIPYYMIQNFQNNNFDFDAERIRGENIENPHIVESRPVKEADAIVFRKDFKKVFAVKIYFQVLKEKIIFPETLSVKD